MPKIPAVAREEWKQRFLALSTANEILQLRDQVVQTYPYAFDDFVRNAYVAGKFAKARDLERVTLRDEPPDFVLKHENGVDCFFEATEALDPYRRRDYEYREIMAKERAGLSTVQHDPVENWLTPEKAGQWLRAAAFKKAKKQYPSGTSLVIYLNGSEYGTMRDEIVAAIVPGTEPAKDNFKEIWVLWDSRAYLAWRNGKPLPHMLHPPVT